MILKNTEFSFRQEMEEKNRETEKRKPNKFSLSSVTSKGIDNIYNLLMTSYNC